ncbi:MAG: Ig-like domain-containing protein [Clostridia bacterium]|nr:Ig-like domain-containing protein [Clostridia bacterium]
MKQWMRKGLLLLLVLMLACPTSVTLSEGEAEVAPAAEEAPEAAQTASESPAEPQTIESAEPQPAEAAPVEESVVGEAATGDSTAPEGAQTEASDGGASAQPETSDAQEPEVSAPADTSAAEDQPMAATLYSSISVSPLTVGVKQTLPLNASVHPADTALKYETSNKKICTVDANGNVKGVAAGTATISITAADGQSVSCTVTVVKAPSKITLSHTKGTLGAGDTFQLGYAITAGTSATITWSSSNSKVATVDANGLITAVSAGSATITAKTHNGKKATCKVTVKKSPTWIKAVQDEVSLGAGQTLEDAFQWDSGAYTQLSYAISDQNVVQVKDDVLTAVGTGEAVVTATTHNGHAAQMKVTVYPAPDSVSLPATELVMGVKQTDSLKAILPAGTMAGLTYASSNKKVVSVDADGNIKALKTGTVTIKVTTHNGKTASCKISVRKAPSSIKFSSKTATVSAEQSLKLSYTITKNSYAVLTWESSNPGIVQVSEDGTITGVSAGTATVRVRTQNSKSATIKVTVYGKPTKVEIAAAATSLGAGQKVELKASTDSANPNAVTAWWSSNAAVAKVSDKGVVEAVSAGTATITAETYNGVTASVQVTVYPAPDSVSLPATELVMGVKQTDSLKAILPEGTMAGLTYASSNKKVVSVDANGNIVALKKGTVTIKVTTHNGKTASCKVSVRSAPSSIKFSSKTAALSVEQSLKLSYTITKNSYAVLTWESSNPGIVQVSEDGTITGVSAGTATVRVRTQNGKSATISITVYAKPTRLTLKTDLAMMGVGQKLSLNVEVDTANPNAVSYTSSNTNVVKVSADGTVQAVGAGTAQITAQTYNGLTDTADITVKAAPSSVRVSPTSITMGVGEMYAINPVITDGSYTQFTYKASNSYVSVTAGGVVTAKKVGTSKVTVTTHNGKKATLTIKVLKAPSSITLDKTALTLEIGSTAQLKYALTKNTVSSVTWYSNNEAVCQVSDAGLLTSVGKGTATITATTANGKSASCKVTCIEPAASVSAVSAVSVQVGESKTLSISAKTASGGDYEGEVTVTSSNEGIAKVEYGNVYGKKSGTCQVTVQAGGHTATVAVTVVSASGSAKADTVMEAALSKLGCKYVWSTHGPNTFDCSGLVYYAYQQIGVKISASSYKQGYSTGTKVSYDELRPGDIVCFNTVENGDDDLVDHTGIYLGDGKFVHASSAAAKVIVSDLTSGYYLRTFSWGRRVL